MSSSSQSTTKEGPPPCQQFVTCQQVCRQWYHLIDHYDSLVWPPCCKRDFQKGIRRRFWSLDFPNPQRVNTAMLSSTSWLGAKHSPTLWRSLYRFTKCWSLGLCTATFLADTNSPLQLERPCVVVGTTQEHQFFTTLSVTRSGHIVRSNPTYKSGNQGRQAMVVHTTMAGHIGDGDSLPFYYLEDDELHGIVCHYSDPTSDWIVTGGLDGTVSLWSEPQRCVTKSWRGHRGRVLSVSMNDEVVISGGSDSMIRVWDLGGAEQRGSIDISSYLSDQHDWFQGVGEIAVNGQLIVCAPDASGPVLVFSLLTGSLVYELKTEPQDVAFTRLCLTPFYLLTKGEINSANQHRVPIYPSMSNSSSTSSPSAASSPTTSRSSSPSSSLSSSTSTTATQSTLNIPDSSSTTNESSFSSIPSPPPPSTTMTPYQLSRYYASTSQTTTPTQVSTRSCIDVWDLQTGKLVYRLVPPLPPNTTASITDIQISPNTAHVFACVEIREYGSRKNHLCCWDFSNDQLPPPSVKILPPLSSAASFGHAWACYY
ncbi:hypothetical protein [Absidia glauca]|uniref:Uncharacterized protein n=1 Tax=Absidia glauca TaxID=4829 RepID=A0A168NZK7_ABSGL|nr:hypothetical protein [Absidia glauca]